MGCCPTFCLKAFAKITPESISEYTSHTDTLQEDNDSNPSYKHKKEGLLNRVFDMISDFTTKDEQKSGKSSHVKSQILESKNATSRNEENMFWNELVKRQRIEREEKLKKIKEEQKKIQEANQELKRIEDEMRKIEEEQEKWVREKLKSRQVIRPVSRNNRPNDAKTFRFDKISAAGKGSLRHSLRHLFFWKNRSSLEKKKYKESLRLVTGINDDYGGRSSFNIFLLENDRSSKQNELPNVTASILEGNINEHADGNIYYIGKYQILNLIGRGCCGKVLLVADKENGMKYAMKVIKKVIRYSTLVNAEKTIMDLLAPTWHPFIVKIFACYQTVGHIIFVMEYLEGRSLNMALSLDKFFTEPRTVFYSACVLLAIGYLHSFDVAHRDIKLENIVLDRYGYPKLIDFGMAVTDVRHNTTIFDKSGTKLYQGPEFLIPGMITRRSSDFWSLGVIIHAMLTGKFITVLPVLVMDVPKLSRNAYDLLKKLFHTNPLERLGAGPNGGKDIMKHVFFKNTKWDDLLLRKIPAPPFKTKPIETLSIKTEWDSLLAAKDQAFQGKLWEDIGWIEMKEVISPDGERNKAGE